ncbi:MAG: CHAD domain-containing protein [Acidimicrobiales bacterium]
MPGREVKLVVGDGFVVPDLDGAVPGARVGPAGERSIRDVYYDTTGFRLARWGCALRFRAGVGWVVKIPVPDSGRVLSRQEITYDAAPGRPPPRALALVRSLTRGEAVEEVACFTTTRFARTWETPAGEVVVELADDRVQVELPDGGCQSWRELEVELAPRAKRSMLTGIVYRLESAGARPGSPGPKLVHAVGEAAAAPPDVTEPTLPDEPTARQVIQAAFARSVTHLLLHVPVARIGEDIEGVHQARVATRRLRSDLGTFRSLLDPDWARSLESELEWLADDLGKVRDADVLLRLLRRTAGNHPELGGVGAGRVVKALEKQRHGDNRALMYHLNRKRTDRLLDRLVAAAADPMTSKKADAPAVGKLRAPVRKRWRHLQRAVDALGPEPPIEELHRIRILAKRTRYAAEAVVPAFGPRAKAFAKSIAGIQDVLGELNDAAVAESWLAALSKGADGPTGFAAGRLTQMITNDAAQFRHGWEKHYRKAGRKKYQAWLQ